ncbi:plastocyanin/azurin family copper-binding protein [Patescibacteria group bacterium]
MDIKTKIHTIISIVLVTLIAALAYWVQLPTEDLKAQVIDTDTVLVRLQDFAFDPDVIRIETDTTISWLHDESDGNADVQHTVTSYDPEDTSNSGIDFESDVMSLGDTFSNTFDEEGVYYYNSSFYPFMTGKVCVGDVSEILDDECAIEVTEGEGGLAEEEVLEEEPVVEEEEEVLPEEDEEVLPEEEEEDLSPAADEDFEEAAEEEEEEVPTFIPPTPTVPPAESAMFDDGVAVTSTAGAALGSDGDLADSGPAEVFYGFLALVAGFMGWRMNKRFGMNK